MAKKATAARLLTAAEKRKQTMQRQREEEAKKRIAARAAEIADAQAKALAEHYRQQQLGLNAAVEKALKDQSEEILACRMFGGTIFVGKRKHKRMQLDVFGCYAGLPLFEEIVLLVPKQDGTPQVLANIMAAAVSGSDATGTPLAVYATLHPMRAEMTLMSPPELMLRCDRAYWATAFPLKSREDFVAELSLDYELAPDTPAT